MRRTVTLFKALSDETRIRIVALLTHGELCVCDIIQVLDLPQSTVSRHLAILRQAGLVEDRRKGVWIYYRLAESSEPVCGDLLDILSGGLQNLDQVRADSEKLRSLANSMKLTVC